MAARILSVITGEYEGSNIINIIIITPSDITKGMVIGD